jgi:hypothetical protein
LDKKLNGFIAMKTFCAGRFSQQTTGRTSRSLDARLLPDHNGQFGHGKLKKYLKICLPGRTCGRRAL